MLAKIKTYFTKPSSSSLIARDAKPQSNIWSASRKIVGGVALLSLQEGMEFLVRQFSSQESPTPNKELSRLANSAGYVLLLEGAYELVSVGILSYYQAAKNAEKNSRHHRQVKKKHGQNGRHAIEKEDTENREIALNRKELAEYHTFLKIQNTIQSSLCAGVTLFSLIRCLRDIKNYSDVTSVFHFSFPEGTSLAEAGLLNFLRIPIMNVLNIILFSLGVVYNTRESMLSFKSVRPRRGDVPFFGLINAYAWMGFSASIANQVKFDVPTDITFPTGYPIALMTKQVEEILNNIKTGTQGGALYRLSVIGNFSAYHYIFQNLIQIVLNTKYLFSNLPYQSSVKIEEIVKLPLLPKPVLQNPETTGINGQPLLSLYEHKKTYGDQKKTQKRKTKTKGLPVLEYPSETIVPPSSEEKKEREELFPMDEAKRREGLDEITQWRLRTEVPRQKIKSALLRLTDLLPEGRLSDRDGAERQISWCFNNRLHKLKYETPHGSDPKFRGDGLEKILNVMEVGFLWGWEKAKREEYLSQRSKGRSIEQLFFVFGERPNASNCQGPTY